jgi:anaerobic selenocysteine-containing dehydrogenase
VWKGEAVGFEQQEQIARRFIHALGSPNYLSNDSMCSLGRKMAYGLVQGKVPRPDFENARCIVLWAVNPPYSQPDMAHDIAAAQRRGARLVVVDPRLSAIARHAEIHAQPRPGTDGALAWGLVHQLVESGAYDKPFVDRYTIGFPKVRQYAGAFTPDVVEEETGVPAATIRAIAQAIEGAAPRVAAYVGNGLEHHENGVNNVRAIAILDVLLGTLGGTDSNRLRDPAPLKELGLYEELPLERLGPLGADRFPVLYDRHRECHTMTAIQAILGEGPYPLRAMIVTGANPALTNPNSSRVVEALTSLDLLVVRDLFMTETAALADYVMPAASFLERAELRPNTRHEIVTLTRRIISLPGVQSEYEFWNQLAARLGIAAYFPWEDEMALNRWLLEPTGLSLEELVAHPEGVRYSPVRAGRVDHGAFDTPSGMVEFTSAYLKDLGYDELPVYRSPAYRHAHNPDYPFVLMTGARQPLYMNSRFRNIPRLRKAAPNPEVEMHPDDALALGVSSGDIVRVTSRIGWLEIPVKVVAANEILAGSLQITHGWREANVNLITDDERFDPISGFPLVKEVEVRVEKAGHS